MFNICLRFIYNLLFFDFVVYIQGIVFLIQYFFGNIFFDICIMMKIIEVKIVLILDNMNLWKYGRELIMMQQFYFVYLFFMGYL